MLAVTRIVTYPAAHRLAAPGFDEAQNLEVYGKCGRSPGHGHGYRIEVSIRGERGDSGEVIDRERLDRLIARTLDGLFNHQNLNHSLRDKQGEARTTTGENLAREVLQRLQAELDAGLEVARVKIHETRKNRFVALAPGIDPAREPFWL